MPLKTTRPPQNLWRRSIMQCIADHPDRPMKGPALGRAIGVADDEYAAFRALLRELTDEGVLVLGPGRTLKLPNTRNLVIGTFIQNRRGFGFIEWPGHPDVFVRAGDTLAARTGDTITARLIKSRTSSLGPRAEITRIVERAEVRWVGVLERRGSQWIVRPQGKTPAPDVVIADPTAKRAKPGDLVVVEPIGDDTDHREVRGVILERLGPPDETENMIRGVIRRHGIPDEFPSAVRSTARRAAKQFETAKFADREDLRELLTITIDPPDARDFDDAISITPLKDGQVELGVHIADVAAFVRPGNALDVEARKRGNSVYFPGTVVPMLPELLSNGVCSLQPDTPRFTKSAFITYDRGGRVQSTRFANSVIRSDKRLTYDEVTAVLEGKTAGVSKPVLQLLKAAERLAKSIRKRRLKNGMIVLNLPAAEIQLDDDGRVVDSRPADTSFSHTLIEMFMVEANDAVCALFAKLNVPHLRRIHPDPGPQAAEAFVRQMKGLGLSPPQTMSARAVQRVLDSVRGTPQEPIVSYLLLRCFSQACYSPSRDGHFALASKHYCHFTSPIRRYPDLLIHRLLDLHARGKLKAEVKSGSVNAPTEDQLEQLGRSTSLTERRAQDAEREAREMLLLKLMATKIGEEFDGLVTGVASFGAFVQLRPTLAEGVVRVADFGSDSWEYDADSIRFVGRRSGVVIRLGQPVRVQVVSVDLVRHELVLVPAEGSLFGTSGRAAGGKSRGRAKGRKRPAGPSRGGRRSRRR